MKHAFLQNRKILILGLGAIGSASLLLILKHIDLHPSQIEILTGDDVNKNLAIENGIKFEKIKLTPENYKNILDARLRENDILINLTAGVSSLDIVKFCQEKKALYLDTSIEAWPSEEKIKKTNAYERRINILKNKSQFINGPTALICHGANPGLISHFAKQAVMDVAQSIDKNTVMPNDQHGWGQLAKKSKIIALYLSEKDSQTSKMIRGSDEYANTWSVDGLLEEVSEKVNFAGKANEILALSQCAQEITIESWVPSGLFSGYVIPHSEAYSLAELFSYPTVLFVYQPCPDAVDSINNATKHHWVTSKKKYLLREEIIEGQDELGVLIIRHQTADIYWFGSRLGINEARELMPTSNATILQVSAGVLSGLVWLIKNPNLGLVEPEQVDFQDALAIASPYLGELKGFWGNWQVPALNDLFSQLAIQKDKS